MAEEEPVHEGVRLFNRLALKSLQEKDYGSAMYLFKLALETCAELGDEKTAREINKHFIPEVTKGMRDEFERIAAERNLQVSDANFDSLFREHSPSYRHLESMLEIDARIGNALKKGPEALHKELDDMVEAAINKIENLEKTKYLAGNIERILGWEEWKGDIEIDLPACYAALEVYSDHDPLGEYQEGILDLKRKLDRIKKFKGKSSEC